MTLLRSILCDRAKLPWFCQKIMRGESAKSVCPCRAVKLEKIGLVISAFLFFSVSIIQTAGRHNSVKQPHPVIGHYAVFGENCQPLFSCFVFGYIRNKPGISLSERLVPRSLRGWAEKRIHSTKRRQITTSPSRYFSASVLQVFALKTCASFPFLVSIF